MDNGKKGPLYTAEDFLAMTCIAGAIYIWLHKKEVPTLKEAYALWDRRHPVEAALLQRRRERLFRGA